MPIVIGGGKSVTDYSNHGLTVIAKVGFTFACNHSAFYFPCDIVVALDPDFIKTNADRLRVLGKPVVVRKWSSPPEGIDLVELPNDIPLVNSGLVAVKLADALATAAGDRKAYIIGIDGDKGHYKGHEVQDSQANAPMSKYKADVYQRMALTSTINLSVHSKISEWPKQSKLPKWDKVIVHPGWRIAAIGFIKSNATKIIEGIK